MELKYRVPVWHVTTSDGATYGVAADTKREAIEFLAGRLSGDGGGPVSIRGAVRVGWGEWQYATVLQYA